MTFKHVLAGYLFLCLIVVANADNGKLKEKAVTNYPTGLLVTAYQLPDSSYKMFATPTDSLIGTGLKVINGRISIDTQTVLAILQQAQIVTN